MKYCALWLSILALGCTIKNPREPIEVPVSFDDAEHYGEQFGASPDWRQGSPPPRVVLCKKQKNELEDEQYARIRLTTEDGVVLEIIVRKAK